MAKQKNNLVILTIIFIVVCIAAFGDLWYLQQNKNSNVPPQQTPVQNNNSESQTTPAQNDNTTTPNLKDVFIPPAMTGVWTPADNQTNVKWRGDGIKMEDLKLVLNADVNYYDMGTDGTNKIILAMVDTQEFGGGEVFFFEQIPSGYLFMSRSSTYATYNPDTKYGYFLSSKVLSADTTTFYAGIVGPTNFTYKGVKLKDPYVSPSDLFSNYLKQASGDIINKIDTVVYGDLYLQKYVSPSADSNPPNFDINTYLVKFPSGLFARYDINYDFFSDNSVPAITWNNGTVNQDSYHQDAHMGGCGNPGSYVVAEQDVSSLVQQTGTTSTGEEIYELKNANDLIVKSFYDLSGGTYNPTTGKYDKIPLEDWYAHHPVIFYKNSLGEYVIFTNDKYGLQAECGKPVIYLYPTKTENIKVRVGADITKSEPLYNNGWHVLANPDGTLTTADGKKYDSLFWEGTGHGNYPNISEGFVVEKNKLADTIKSQLKELGLSKKESSDFLDFWQPKMPNTPYTRLTWFTTQQMNVLAPLAIFPKPDTVIRIFLDFQGLESPTLISPQNLTSLPRQGFTVVEWGGILKK